MGKSFPKRLASNLLLLYEDRDIIVLDKPEGLPTIAPANRREKNVYGILCEYYSKKGGGGSSPAVVHRLDRDTSGVIIFAKSGRVKKKLMDNWDEIVTERRYVCVAEGVFAEEAGVIDLPLGEDSSRRVVVKKGGMPALTRWKLLRGHSGYSLLSLELETGRRNQIRAHLAALGRPVAGDKKYWAKTDPLKRLCLHAGKISFYHPRDGKLMEFESSFPQEFSRLLS